MSEESDTTRFISKDEMVAAFKKVFPKTSDPEGWVEALQKLPLYDIDTPKRISAFLAQCAHESMQFKALSENLNYSESALNNVFPKYFKRAGRNAAEYARKPEKIANVVYANRMGNGNTESGDGWRYRGRGLIQLTGKSNYTKFAEDFDLPEVLENPDIVSEKKYAVLSALWFWTINNLNDYADDNDLTTMTKRINGGTNGLQDRIAWYNKIYPLIKQFYE